MSCLFQFRVNFRIMDMMDELLRSRNFDYKNIGELRKHVLSSFVEKSPYGLIRACVVGTIHP